MESLWKGAGAHSALRGTVQIIPGEAAYRRRACLRRLLLINGLFDRAFD
jgi:hypothetical protein